MALNSVEKEWEGFSNMIFAGTLPTEVQIVETKKAFFAGALAILTAVQEIGEPHIPEQVGIDYLSERKREVDLFYSKLITEYASKN